MLTQNYYKKKKIKKIKKMYRVIQLIIMWSHLMHTSEGVGHFESNSVADCSWQRYILTARKASFAEEEKM